MIKLRFLLILFTILTILIILLFPYSRQLSAASAFLSAVVLSMALFRFLMKAKIKKIREIKIEEIIFARNYLFRTYFKPKDLWIVYDKRTNRFRPADFRDMPLRVGFLLIVGVFFLYTSYLISLSLFDITHLIPIRALTLILLVVVGFYSFSVSVGRIVSLANRKDKEASKFLNKHRSLRNFIKKDGAYVQITPNFTFDGFVTSMEIVTKRKHDSARIEKYLLDVSRELYKH